MWKGRFSCIIHFMTSSVTLQYHDERLIITSSMVSVQSKWRIQTNCARVRCMQITVIHKQLLWRELMMGTKLRLDPKKGSGTGSNQIEEHSALSWRPRRAIVSLSPLGQYDYNNRDNNLPNWALYIWDILISSDSKWILCNLYYILNLYSYTDLRIGV